jgi:hypothetical protein
MAELRVTELEFQQIKSNLIQYLSATDQFSDYNFEGSGISNLLDILAYNTHYNAVLAHLQANEMFIDTAVKRSSVVSIAKTLGYTPRSVIAAKARVNVVVESLDSGPLVLPAGTKFSAALGSQSFTFVSLSEKIADNVGGTFTFVGVDIAEGVVITQRQLVTPNIVSGPITIKNNNIDLSTLRVTVENSQSDLTTTAWKLSETVIDITRDDTVYWVEEGQDGYYKLFFGDDIIGKKLSSGNIVNIEYVASQGAAANGSQTFSIEASIGGGAPITTLVSAASGGSDREDVDSIRFNAPRYNATRGRAVTVEDYKSLILSSFDKAKSVAVWGGEQNVPPIYGKVFMSIDPKNNYIITESDKDNIINNVIRPRSVMSIQHEFVDPTFLHVGMAVKVSYNAKTTPYNSNQIAGLVAGEIRRYFASELSTLDKKFYYAQLLNRIQTSQRSILGTLIDLRLQRRIVPILNVPESLNVYFTTAIEPNSFKSTNFKTVVQGVEYTAFIRDYPDTTPPSKTGTGTLHLIDVSNGKIIDNDYGEIYYGDSGLFTINRLFVTQLLAGAFDVRFNALPQDLNKDLSPTIVRSTPAVERAVYPFPSQNIVVVLDDSQQNRALGSVSGLTVTAEPFEG